MTKDQAPDTTAALVEALSEAIAKSEHADTMADELLVMAHTTGISRRANYAVEDWDEGSLGRLNRWKNALAAHRATPRPSADTDSIGSHFGNGGAFDPASADVAGQVSPSPAEIAEEPVGYQLFMAGLNRWTNALYPRQEAEASLAKATNAISAIRPVYAALALTDIGAPGVDRGEGV